jgi:hypothetical protein
MFVRSAEGTPPWHNTRRPYNRLEALVTIDRIWSSHFRLFWIIKPNTFCEYTVSSTWLSIVKGGSCLVSLRKQTWSSLNILTFNFIQLLDDHESIESRVNWVTEKLFEVRFSEDETSSINFHIFVSGEFTLRSLIIMWGTILDQV